MGVNFGETNHLSPLLYLLALHYLISSSYCASASIYLVVVILCVGVTLCCSTSSTEAIHQVTFVLEVEKRSEEHFGVLTNLQGRIIQFGSDYPDILEKDRIKRRIIRRGGFCLQAV